ncbi:hypothetical protein SDC9_141540 [bioreactor metagenome]|uniref:Uncharacterized protein n=1 Tax=bioreactor metagenome TaxID=1076179 RepID=A0A645DXY8_9ZZZZ
MIMRKAYHTIVGKNNKYKKTDIIKIIVLVQNECMNMYTNY